MLLKNFSDSRKKLFMYEREKNKFQKDIPYLSQCQKDNFYGKTHEIEDFLSKIEHITETIIRNVIIAKDSESILDINEYRILSIFVISQYLRTRGHLERTVDSLEDFKHRSKDIISQFYQAYESNETVDEALERLLPSIDFSDIAGSNVSIAFGNYSSYSDLAVLLVNNKTNINFIISNDPVIAKNYYYPKNGYGLNSVGVFYFLPIDTKTAVLLIDEVAYFKPGTISPYINLIDESDIIKLNTWQFSKSNLLYSFDETSLRNTINRNLEYIKNNAQYVRRRLRLDLSREKPYLSIEEINKLVEVKMQDTNLFNETILDVVEEDNIPSFLHIYEEIRKKGRNLYFGIPLRKDI